MKPLILGFPCEGYKDELNGDYDCCHLFPPDDCEDCVILYEKTGGRIDPRTGKIFRNDKGSSQQKREDI